MCRASWLNQSTGLEKIQRVGWRYISNTEQKCKPWADLTIFLAVVDGE